MKGISGVPSDSPVLRAAERVGEAILVEFILLVCEPNSTGLLEPLCRVESVVFLSSTKGWLNFEAVNDVVFGSTGCLVCLIRRFCL